MLDDNVGVVLKADKDIEVVVPDKRMPADLTWRGLIETAVEAEVDGVTVKEAVVARLIGIVKEGSDSASLRAIDMLFDRLDGRVATQGDNSGDESPFQAWIKGLRTGEKMMIGVKKESSE